MHNIGFMVIQVVYKTLGCIEGAMCLILTVFRLNLYMKALRL